MNSGREVKWADAYRTGDCAWDTRVPSPELVSCLERLHLPPSRVLDVGCGTGANAVFLAQQGHSVVAIDFVAEAITKAKRMAPEFVDRIDFRVTDFLTLADFRNEFLLCV